MRGLHVVEPAPDPTAAEPVVVFIHGAMDRGTSFARVARHLPDRRWVRYDRRGYGGSVAAGVGDLATHVDDLWSVLGGQPAVVVGHSLGAVIALSAAVEAPDQVRGVVAFEPALPWEPWWRAGSAGSQALAAGGDGSEVDAGAVAERFMRTMLGEGRWRRLPPGTRAQRRAEGPALIADLRSMRAERAPVAPGLVRVPAVVGFGSETSDRHRRGAEQVAAGLPHGELRCIDGAGHGAHLSHPPEFAALVRQLTDRLPPA